MAAINSTNPSQPGSGFGGDEFSNNLFSDLAPLLTLFGEQVTKQFLSMSMGWEDDILLAMGPLGIMTIIVSAIRVGGIRSLKAFVGRARESRANAEREILSSTSEDVCELWSGREIVRELGNAEGMKDIIILGKPIEINHSAQQYGRYRRRYSDQRENHATQVLDIKTAVSHEVLPRPHSGGTPLTDEEILNISNGSPNIALNVLNSTASVNELRIWAVIGTMLQLSALAFPAVSTYHFKWRKGTSMVAAYGYPCFITGTIAVIVGVVFCGRVIEGSTTEHEFRPHVPLQRRSQEDPRIQVMRLQKACTVSDQHFSSFAIFNSPNDVRIRTSRLNEKRYNRMAAVATLTAVVGFVIQFVGLRALHWSATVYQLGIMLVLTIIRSWVRRGLAANPIFYPLLDGHELAWLALYILNCNQEDERLDRAQQQGQSSPTSTGSENPYFSPQTDNELYPQPIHIPGDLGNISQSPRQLNLFSSIPFTRSFPFVKKLKVSKIEHERQPQELMFEVITRWEPFTGYYNVKDLCTSLASTNAETVPDKALRDILHSEHSRLSMAFAPLPNTAILQSAKYSPDNPQLLKICRDLQRLMPNSSEASASASALAIAIERVMTLLIKSPHILWRDDSVFSPSKSRDYREAPHFRFSVPIARGTYSSQSETHVQKLRIVVTSKWPDPEETDEEPHESEILPIWTTDREILDSVLCLWLFSLEVRKGAATRLITAFNMMARADIPLMNHDQYQLISPRNIYYRIVAPMEPVPDQSPIQSSRPSIFDQLLRWFTSVVYVPPLGQTYSQNSLSEIPPELENRWVVWGSNFSTLTCLEPSFDPDHPIKHEEYAVLTRPDTSIAGHCALEIFSYFMDTIASSVEIVGGRTVLLSPAQFTAEVLEPRRSKNSVFESIATECVSAGLAHDNAEAYTVIIPAFLKNNLLPKKTHEEVRFRQEPTGDVTAIFDGKEFTGSDEQVKKYLNEKI